LLVFTTGLAATGVLAKQKLIGVGRLTDSDRAIRAAVVRSLVIARTAPLR
jgi:hypothetical protein